MIFREILAQLLARVTHEAAGFDIVTPTETEEWEDGALATCLAIGLLRPATPSPTVLCPACDEGHEAEVIYLASPGTASPRACISCPTFGMVRVDPADQRRWRIDAEAFATHVAGALTSSAPQELGHLGWCLGLRAAIGQPRDLVLWLDANAPPDVILRGLADPVFFLPAEPPGELWPPHVVLGRFLLLARGELSLNEQYLDSVLASSPGARHQQYAFRRDGDAFTITFRGRTHPYPNLLGLRYLHLLLQNEDLEISVADLFQAVQGTPGAKGVVFDDADEEDRSWGLEDDAGEVIDKKALASYKKRLKDLAEEIKQARTLGDDEKVLALTCEFDTLSHTTKSVIDREGRLRRAKSRDDRKRKSIQKAVKDALACVRGSDEELYVFLSAHTKTGWKCRYTPSSYVCWDLG